MIEQAIPRREKGTIVIREHLETFPFDTPPQVIERRADLLLAEPLPGPIKAVRDQPPLQVVHFTSTYVKVPFDRPRGVYESDHLRVEWQTMNGRQPFYHRNCDVDEISFQVDGERTLMTDLGSVEFRPGELARIPVGSAHDNYGRADIHILFYVPAPVREVRTAHRHSEPAIPPFDGWEPAIVNELVTECLGGPGHDIVMAPTDELTLLEQAKAGSAAIPVLRPDDAPGTIWLYSGDQLMIGRCFAKSSDGALYRRIRNAEEIQYQISGERTLVSQRGTVRLVPGDFVRIPVGIAATSIHETPSAHLTLVSTRETPQVAESTGQAERGTI